MNEKERNRSQNDEIDHHFLPHSLRLDEIELPLTKMYMTNTNLIGNKRNWVLKDEIEHDKLKATHFRDEIEVNNYRN